MAEHELLVKARRILELGSIDKARVEAFALLRVIVHDADHGRLSLYSTNNVIVLPRDGWHLYNDMRFNRLCNKCRTHVHPGDSMWVYHREVGRNFYVCESCYNKHFSAKAATAKKHAGLFSEES